MRASHARKSEHMTTLKRKHRYPRRARRSDIADRLHALIGKESKRSFAKKCGLDSARVSEWVSGQVAPGAHNLQAIASATDCSVDWLLGLSEQRYRGQTRTGPELADDVAAYLRRAVGAAVGIKPDMLRAEGTPALEDMKEREVRAFKAVQKWNRVFAAVITRKFSMMEPGKRPRLDTPEWGALYKETLKDLSSGDRAGWRPPSSNVSIGRAREA